MRHKDLTKAQLIAELDKARQHIAELQADEAKRQKAEESLKESEAKYRFLTERMNDIVWTLDLNLQTTYVSPSIDKFLGSTPEERVNINPLSVMIPESYALVTQVLGEELQREMEGNADPDRTITIESEYPHKNGSIVRAESIVSAIRDAEGYIIGIHGVSRDITQHKKAEEALKKSEKKYRDLEDFLPQMVFETDLNGYLTFVNQAGFAISGYSQTDFEQGVNVLETLIPEDRERALANMQLILSGQKAADNDYTLLKKDGGTFPIIVYANPIIHNNVPVGVRGLVVDISSNKRIEDALRESERKYRSIFNNTTEGIFQTTPQGRVLTANPALSIILGYDSPDDIIQSIKNLGTDLYVHSEKRQEFLELMNKQGYVRNFEWQAYRKDHSIIDVSINVDIVRDENNNLLYFEGVLKDVTELKRYRERMEELVRERTDELMQVNKNLQEEITERKKVESALRDSESKYHSIFNNTTEGIFQTTPQGRVLTANPALATILGYDSPEDFIRGIKNLGTDLFVKSERRQEFLELMKKQGYVRGFEYHAYRKDRQIINATINVDIIRDENHNFLYFEGVFKDVTELKRYQENMEELVRERTNELISANKKMQSEIAERRQAEAALQESEKKLRGIIENIQELYYRIDAQGKMAMINPSGLKMLGYESEEEVLGRQVSEFWLNPEERAKYLSLFKDGRIDQLEINLQRKDGSMLEGSISSHYYYDDQGRELGIEGVIRDISKRKRAEEALQASQAKLQAIFDNIGTGIFIIDRDTQIITEANQAAIKMIGLSKEMIIGQICTSVICPPIEGSCPVKDLGQIIHQSERKLFHADGHQIDILKTVYPITIKGRNCYLESFIDISDRKQAEEEKQSMEERLQRAQKMEALGTMAGGVAHDLNNILGILVGYSELLLMEIPSAHPLRRHVNNILKSGERAAAIIQDLLTLARRGVSVSEAVNLNKIIADYLTTPELESLKSFHPQVTIKTNLEKNLLNIKGSPVHLGKSLMNLVSNAAEAITGRGEVTIETNNIYLDRPLHGYDDMNEGEYVVLKISDTGTGISAKDMGKIFEPFYTKKVMGRSGTGLGLAVVWGTVKDHHGFIDVQSEESKGSSFNLYFPVTREARQDDQQAVLPEVYKGNGETILVVDDVKEQRELAMHMLQKLGYSICSLPGGEEAVAYIKENKVDLLILDMIMDPGIDGLETYQRILQINPTQKAIIVSGFSETDRVKKAQMLGAGSYVKKPYVLESIGLAVRKELDRTR